MVVHDAIHADPIAPVDGTRDQGSRSNEKLDAAKLLKKKIMPTVHASLSRFTARYM
jgi:hypothetical protein